MMDDVFSSFILTRVSFYSRLCNSPVSPRPYRLGQRQVLTDQARERVLTATRSLLMTSNGFSGFSMEAVARLADVTRMTVYHQFGSKTELLEALCDSLAASGGMEQLATAFRQPEPLDALMEYITVFSHFWDADRLVLRRLRGLAALDLDFEPSGSTQRCSAQHFRSILQVMYLKRPHATKAARPR
jgi:AcrR family transcriptional regulator